MKKLYINMPAGELYGWAICGKNLIAAMNKLTDKIRYVPDERYDNAARDYSTTELIKSITESPNGKAFDTLHCIDNVTPMKVKGEKNVGYMFWEQPTLPEHLIAQLKDYDIIATGSSWNTEVVKSHGFNNVVTVHQGVNCDIFKPMEKRYFHDKFVIFSGGKLEHRKAQDIVAEVVGRLQKKYHDIYLISAWGNVFASQEEYEQNLRKLKKHLDPERTMIIDITSQDEMVKYIAETDMGFFPNRYEGGTNLVMMEYMACGKPVVANNATGQNDVLMGNYAALIDGNDEELIKQSYDAFELAYHEKRTLEEMGKEAREAMQKFTWENTAKEFLKLYE